MKPSKIYQMGRFKSILRYSSVHCVLSLSLAFSSPFSTVILTVYSIWKTGDHIDPDPRGPRRSPGPTAGRDLRRKNPSYGAGPGASKCTIALVSHRGENQWEWENILYVIKMEVSNVVLVMPRPEIIEDRRKDNIWDSESRLWIRHKWVGGNASINAVLAWQWVMKMMQKTASGNSFPECRKWNQR